MKNRPRGGLGRGLGALIPTAPAAAAPDPGEAAVASPAPPAAEPAAHIVATVPDPPA